MSAVRRWLQPRRVRLISAYATAGFLAAGVSLISAAESWRPIPTLLVGLGASLLFAFFVLVPVVVQLEGLPDDPGHSSFDAASLLEGLVEQVELSLPAFAYELERWPKARSGMGSVSPLVRVVELLERRTEHFTGHSHSVARFGRDVAIHMGLDGRLVLAVYRAGLLHDIGDLAVPQAIIEKSGALTLDERRIMQRHSVDGASIVGADPALADLAVIIRHHHERVDGQGYPEGLVGDSIPIGARILQVVDAYAAMTAHRPYRHALPSRVARSRLAQAVDAQFDRSVVAAFEAILIAADDEYRDLALRLSGEWKPAVEPEHEVPNVVHLFSVAER